jgi:AraC family transcriptional regulator of adaptative response/methylated-DNA-[protein]-cysteine methyltransferase
LSRPRDTERIRHAVRACVLGHVLVAATDRGVCTVELGDSTRMLALSLQRQFPEAILAGTDAILATWVDRVVDAIARPRTSVDLPLDIRGTVFQQSVWAALRAIPPGATVSYRQVAARIGRPGAARAVARACASNRLALLVPCHRVVRADGGAGGYRWGIERKQRLLDGERG